MVVPIIDPAEEIAASPPEWLPGVAIVLDARASLGSMESPRAGIELWARARGLDGGPSQWLLEAIGVIDAELDRLRHQRAVERAKKARETRKSAAERTR